MGAELTPWQQFQMTKYGPGWSYDPATQILTGPGGYSLSTPMQAPFYQPTTSETSEQILERIYPEYAAFLHQGAPTPPAPLPPATGPIDSSFALPANSLFARVEALPSPQGPIATQSTSAAATQSVPAPAAAGIPTWLWVVAALGAAYIFTSRK